MNSCQLQTDIAWIAAMAEELETTCGELTHTQPAREQAIETPLLNVSVANERKSIM